MKSTYLLGCPQFLAVLLLLFSLATLPVAYSQDPAAKPAQPSGDHAAMGHEEKAQPPGAPTSENEQAQQPPGPPPSPEQIEASRLQLEASRAQLEASRKALEASAPEKAGQPATAPAELHQHGENSAADGEEKKHSAGETEHGGKGGNSLLGHLKKPAYMHVLLNPMPVYGLSMGVLAMLVGLFYRSRPAIITALVLIFVAGFSAWPVYSYGQAAYDEVKMLSDSTGEQWLDEHMARAEKLIYAFYLVAAVALAGILAPLKWPRTAFPLAITSLVLGVATLGIGGWISYAGGHVRHEEFRFEPPPSAKSEEHHHHGGGETDHDAAHGEHTEGQSKPVGDGHSH